jgi:hypothetical protein
LKVTVLISLLVLSSALWQLAYSAQTEQPAPVICESADYRIFDRLLGNWEVYQGADEKRKHLGSMQTQIIARGCAMKQTFTANQQGISNESLAYLDSDGTWTAIHAADDGQVDRFRWQQNEEELIRLKVGGAGSEKRRVVTFDISQDQHRVLEERSSDWGQSWAQHSLTHVVRKVSPPVIESSLSEASLNADPVVEYPAVAAKVVEDQAGEDSALEDIKLKEKEAEHAEQ